MKKLQFKFYAIIPKVVNLYNKTSISNASTIVTSIYLLVIFNNYSEKMNN